MNHRKEIEIGSTDQGFESHPLLFVYRIDQPGFTQNSSFYSKGQMIQDAHLGLYPVFKLLIETQRQGKLQFQARLDVDLFDIYSDIQITEGVRQRFYVTSVEISKKNGRPCENGRWRSLQLLFDWVHKSVITTAP